MRPSTVLVESLLRLPGIDRAVARALLAAEPLDPEAVRAASGCTARAYRAAEAAAREDLERAAELGLTVLTAFDEAFPDRLRRIPDPPLRLFVQGDPCVLAGRSAVAVVGTRRPTEDGARMASRLGRMAAEAGLVVVSGLAAGCDTAAHRGCLASKGLTIASLAHGLDSVYPPENRSLAESIARSGGALISEYPPGTEALPHHFVERDRLQSGLAEWVLVVETDGEEGTMHTARFAREQKRLLACVEPPADAPAAPWRGNLRLLEQGALPLRGVEDAARLLASLAAR